MQIEYFKLRLRNWLGITPYHNRLTKRLKEVEQFSEEQQRQIEDLKKQLEYKQEYINDTHDILMALLDWFELEMFIQRIEDEDAIQEWERQKPEPTKREFIITPKNNAQK